MPPILFVHIPKTAGTSFRSSLVEHFGKPSVELDYGSSAVETTPLTRHHIYEAKNPDIYGFHHHFENNKGQLLAGHFPAAKYGPMFGAKNIIAFCRDPYERAKSHYLHRRRVLGVIETFSEFIELPAYQNLQSKHMQNVPLEAIGAFGITEKYEDSLKVINHQFGISIQHNQLNQAPKGDTLKVSDTDRARFNALNQGDLTLYTAARVNFDRHLNMVVANKNFIRCAMQRAGNHIIGWAFQEDNNMPLNINVYLNSEPVTAILATEYRAHLDVLGVPRKGYVGFRAKIGACKDGDTIELKHNSDTIYLKTI